MSLPNQRFEKHDLVDTNQLPSDFPRTIRLRRLYSKPGNPKPLGFPSQ